MTNHEASASIVAPVRLLSRPGRAAGQGLPPPPPGRMLRVFVGAIPIGSTAAVVGAYYITLAATFPPGALALFLAVLAALVGASIFTVFLVHRRVSARVVAWLPRPGDGVDRGAWRQALNYPVHLSVAVGLSALAVSVLVAVILALATGDVLLAVHISVGGGLAAILDAIFAWLYTDWALRPLRRVMAVREPLLPVSGHGIVHLGLGAKMAVVIIGASLVSVVVSGTLAYRAATDAVPE